jgi:hypothetical protein
MPVPMRIGTSARSSGRPVKEDVNELRRHGSLDACARSTISTKPRLAGSQLAMVLRGVGLGTFAVRITACRLDSRVTVSKQSCDRPQLAQARVYAREALVRSRVQGKAVTPARSPRQKSLNRVGDSSV